MNETLHTKFGDSGQIFEDACKIRIAVFCDEQGVHPDDELDNLDPGSYHSVVYVQDEPVACGRFFVEGTVGRIGRLAVLKDHRRKGYAALICKYYLEMARQHDLDSIFLHGQTHAIPFYEKLGFVAEGEEFIEDDIPHAYMSLSLRE